MTIAAPWLLFIIVAAVDATAYSLAFLYLLGRRIIQKLVDNEGMEEILVFQVALACLTATIWLNAVLLIFLDRHLAGMYFYLGTTIGIFLIAISAAGIGAEVKAAIWLGAYTKRGVILGNLVLLVLNILTFLEVWPSAL